MSELRNCPFCGSPAKANAEERCVECTKCTATTYCQDDVELAIKQWNRRPSPWRSVKEKPPRADPYFAVTLDGFYTVAHWDGATWGDQYILRWMPIPPKEETMDTENNGGAAPGTLGAMVGPFAHEMCLHCMTINDDMDAICLKRGRRRCQQLPCPDFEHCEDGSNHGFSGTVPQEET